MKKHIKIYFQHFKIAQDDRILCEYCGMQAVDVHHIDNKGLGGSKKKDDINNLIALCRKCHDKAHNELISKSDLRLVHNYKLSGRPIYTKNHY
jgi:5-methylcytosine-specific restriction endonuclease McrA